MANNESGKEQHAGFLKPITFKDLVGQTLDQEKYPEEKFLRAFKIIESIRNPDYDFSQDLPHGVDYTSVLSEIMIPKEPLMYIGDVFKNCEFYIDNNVGIQRTSDMDDQQYNELNTRKKQQYKDSLVALFKLVKPLSDFNLSSQLYNIGQDINNFISYPESTGEVEINEYQIPGFKDRILLSVAEHTKQEDIDAVLAEVNRVWLLLRSKDSDPQTLNLLLIDNDKVSNYRSFASMKNNPSIVLNMKDKRYISVARHEAVHAVFGAEAGSSLSSDFSEGTALLFEYGFEPDDEDENMRNLVNMTRGYFGNIKDDKVQNIKLRSHTQFVDDISSVVNKEQIKKEASYIFGYCLVRSIVQSKTFRENRDSDVLEGKNPYSLLIEMHRAFSPSNKENDEFYKKEVDGQMKYVFKAREEHARVLGQFGFDVDQTFDDANNKLRDLLSNY